MAKYSIEDTTLTGIANAIRTKSSTSTTYTPSQMAKAIEDIETGSTPILQEKTVTPITSSQVVTADVNYDGLSQVTVNAMPTATQATPSITVSSAGLITASATQSAGYVEVGTKSATKQLTTKAATTITPSKSTQVAVASGVYTTGTVTVASIPDTYIQPTGTLSITENGTHNVSAYASATVNVETGGGGGSVETCTVELIADAPALHADVYYSSANMVAGIETMEFMDWKKGKTFTVAKGTIFMVVGTSFTAWSITGNATLLVSNAFFVEGNCSLVGG